MLVDAMNAQLDAGPLALRVIDSSSNSQGDDAIDLCDEADRAPVARGRSERAAKVAAEAERKKQREKETQAAEKAATEKLKTDMAAARKRKQAADRQANMRKAPALGLGKVARSPP